MTHLQRTQRIASELINDNSVGCERINLALRLTVACMRAAPELNERISARFVLILTSGSIALPELDMESNICVLSSLSIIVVIRPPF
jgi:hypothetical protein